MMPCLEMSWHLNNTLYVSKVEFPLGKAQHHTTPKCLAPHHTTFLDTSITPQACLLLTHYTLLLCSITLLGKYQAVKHKVKCFDWRKGSEVVV